MVKLTIENEEVKKEFNSRYVFAVIGDPDDEADMAIAFIGKTSPQELAEQVGKSFGTQVKFLTDKISSRFRLCEILSKEALLAMIGDEVEVKEVETNIEED